MLISKHKLENANQGNGGYEKWNNMFCIILILPYTLISFGECTKPVFLRVFQNVDIFYEKDIRKSQCKCGNIEYNELSGKIDLYERKGKL